jgi:hypothetical protein
MTPPDFGPLGHDDVPRCCGRIVLGSQRLTSWPILLIGFRFALGRIGFNGCGVLRRKHSSDTARPVRPREPYSCSLGRNFPWAHENRLLKGEANPGINFIEINSCFSDEFESVACSDSEQPRQSRLRRARPGQVGAEQGTSWPQKGRADRDQIPRLEAWSSRSVAVASRRETCGWN